MCSLCDTIKIFVFKQKMKVLPVGFSAISVLILTL